MTRAKFYIYRNLHTGGFSIKKGGIVVDRIACGDSVIAEGISFRVSECGNNRVINEKKKNVHAYAVVNNYNFEKQHLVDNLKIISYNPYKSANFVCNENLIDTADLILFQNGKCYLLQ